MEIEFITKADLQTFRLQLLQDLKLLLESEHVGFSKPWLRHKEVCQLLNISASTLKRMRIGGKLSSVKVGGIHYYDYKGIQKLLAENA